MTLFCDHSFIELFCARGHFCLTEQFWYIDLETKRRFCDLINAGLEIVYNMLFIEFIIYRIFITVAVT